MENYLFNFILVGSDNNVGTSSIISKITNNNNFKTKGNENLNNDCKTIKIGNNITIKQLLSDSKSYDSLSPDYGRVEAFFIIFDLTNKQSFLNIEKIIKNLKIASWGESLFIIVGNKSDIKDQRQVTLEEAKEYSKSLESQYFEISTKDNESSLNDIESMFYYASLINLNKKLEESSKGAKSIKKLQCYYENIINVKYLIIGDKSVGKSTLHNSIKDNSISIIDNEPGYINSFVLEIEGGNKNVAINTIDYNGSFDELSITTSNYDSILMIIDITNKSSLEYLEQIYQDIIKNKNKMVLLIGNKNDIDQDKREISFELAKSFANEKLNSNYIETSFTNNFNDSSINQLLLEFTKDVIKIIQINNQIKFIKKKKTQQKKDCIIC